MSNGCASIAIIQILGLRMTNPNGPVLTVARDIDLWDDTDAVAVYENVTLPIFGE
jgi:hypothetical protein